MGFSLQDLFYTSATIAFALFSILTVAVFILLFRVLSEIKRAIKNGNDLIEEFTQSRNTGPIRFMRLLFTIFGGDRKRE